jgi:hypothetical protein
VERRKALNRYNLTRHKAARLALIGFLVAFSLLSVLCRSAKGPDQWLSGLFEEGKKIFYSTVKKELSSHPKRGQLTEAELDKIGSLERKYPRVYGILINLYYQKKAPEFKVFLQRTDETSRAKFREMYLDLARFAGHNFFRSFFFSSPNADYIRDIIPNFHGKDRFDLILLSLGYFARLDIPTTEKEAGPLNPEFEKQWGLDAGRFRSAHKITKGEGARIAVIDSGIDGNHPVFRNTHFGEHFCLVGRDGPPWDEHPPAVDWGWHGTVVSSIVACYAPGARITMYKAMDADTMNNAPYPLFLAHFMAACIYRAVHDGNDVINISAGLGNDFPYLRNACQYAYDNNVMIVAASPYYLGKYLGTNSNFPGSYDTTISVTGIAQIEEGSYGYWDIAAPEFTTTIGAPCAPFVAYPVYEDLEDEYAPGISCATPIAASAAALAVSIYPRLGIETAGAYFETIKKILIETANSKACGFDGFSPECGYGLVDALRMVHTAGLLQSDRLAFGERNKR